MARKKYNSRQLTDHIRELLAEASEVMEEGDNGEIKCLTKGEVLADLIVKRALGYRKTTRTDEGEEKTEEFPPERWAIELVWDRVEGKTPQAVQEDDRSLRVAERVSDLSKKRLNKMTERLLAVTGDTTPPPPPEVKRNDG